MSSNEIIEQYIPILTKVGITAQSMENSFSQITLQRGIDYFNEDRVVLQNVDPDFNDGIQIGAEVQGSGSRIYNIEVTIAVVRNQLSIIGECDCPVGFRCKHAVATILEFARSYEGFQDGKEISFEEPDEVQQVESWLNTLNTPQQVVNPLEAKNALSASNNSVLLYVIKFSEVDEEQGMEINTISARRLKKGGYGKGREQNIDDLTDSYSASYVNYEFIPLDVEIAGLLQSMQGGLTFYNHGRYLLSGDIGELVLKKLLKTNKLFYETQENSEPMSLGEQRLLSLNWERVEDSFYLDIDVEYATEGVRQALFYMNQYYYIDRYTHKIGLAQHAEIDNQQIQKLISAPPIPFSMAAKVSEQLVQIWPESRIPVPIESDREIIDIAVTPNADVVLSSVEIEQHRVHVLSLRFNYDGHIIQPEKYSKNYQIIADQKQYQIIRDIEFEKVCIETLRKHNFVSIKKLPDIETMQFAQLDQTLVAESATAVLWYWHDFQFDLLPKLEEQGWHFKFEENFHMQIEEVEEWYGELEEKDSNDWFEISLGIELNGKNINLLPSLVELLSLEKDPQQLKEKILSREHIIMPISEDENKPRWVKLPSDRIMGIYDTLVELYDTKALNDEGNLILSNHQGMQLTALLNDPKLKWKGAQELQAISKKLLDFKGIESVTLPDNLDVELRDYQIHGLDWLQFMREYHFNGILADDMGLGKTVQALSHLLYEKQNHDVKSPTLVVAPTSLMGNWKREAKKYTPDLKILLLHGPERKELFESISQYDIILTTYSLMLRDKDFHSEQDYHFVILDEAQNIKNARSKRSQVIFKLKSKYRLCMTGTPMENHLGELWSLFHFLMPGFLGAQERFNRLFRTPIEKKGDYDRQIQLHQRIKPFMLRRTKEMVATELPAKTEIIRTVPLSGKQRDLYETVRLAMDKQVQDEISKKGLARSHIMILDALLKLRQTCCDPRILSLTKAKDMKESAKLEMLMEMVPEMVEEGRKILIFSQFVKMLDIIEQELIKESISYSKLTGQTRNRDEVINAFQEGDAKVFLISLKAGGVGLNLTAADTVIHYDPWWNPAVERQATDRAHRIGQDKPIFVYKLLTEETVEEKILQMQKNKQKLADALYQDKNNKDDKLVDGENKTPEFTQDDLMELLKPLD